MSLMTDIKLIKTDTALDLSQKAEKGMEINYHLLSLYIPQCGALIWDKRDLLALLPASLFFSCLLLCVSVVMKNSFHHS